MIGEGANLGMTQLGRVEYGCSAAALNTDFIDNSGGVDCSDHEVNIKIALGAAKERGEIDEPGRQAILVEMTDDVAELVLRDNYLQSQAISLVEFAGRQAARRPGQADARPREGRPARPPGSSSCPATRCSRSAARAAAA